MNKSKLVQSIVSQLEVKRALAVNAANQAHETATHTETVAKSKYETFGLEASYLAHGQAKRVAECEAEINLFSSMPILDFTEESQVGISALVTIEDSQGELKTCFVAPGGGGLKLEAREALSGYEPSSLSQFITVITPSSPLGSALIGRSMFDSLTLDIGCKVIVYEIVGIF